MPSPSRTRTRTAKPEDVRRAETEREARYRRVFRRASEVLGEPSKAAEWLRIENRALGGITPESLLGSDQGLSDVEDLLGRIEHGVFN